MIKVLKFGGTSVGSAERVDKVAEIIEEVTATDFTVVVVVSAVGGITDQLVDCARTAETNGVLANFKLEKIRQRHLDVFAEEIKVEANLQALSGLLAELQDLLKGVGLVKECSPRTMDLILSFGERLSATMMTALLRRKSLAAEFLDSRQVVVTDKRHGNARVLIDPTFALIKKRVHSTGLYVATGFIGASEDGITTTLGRGGSDYSAALFGAALDASQIEIWTDVDGFMSADPRLVKEAFVLPRISYEEASEMSYFGAKVIHPQTLAPAVNKKIPVLIKNSFAPEKPGTIISPDRSGNGHPVKGIASFSGVSLINLQGTGMVGVPGTAGRLFGALAAKGINVIMISQASSEHSICFTVQSADAALACETISTEFEAELLAGKIDKVERKDDLTILAAVGENMVGKPGISGKFFEALGQNSINVIAIAQGSSERNLSVVVASNDAVKAVNVVHSSFYLSRRIVNLFIAGVGSIGSTLLNQIKERQAALAGDKGLVLNVCGVANSKKMIVGEKGINLDAWNEQLKESAAASSMSAILDHIHRLKLVNPILIDVSASNHVADHYADFLGAGVHIVAANKRANTRDQAYYDRIMSLANGHRVHYRYQATVGAGLPIISTLQNLRDSGDEIIKIEGILSGTLGYLFRTLSPQRTFSQVLREAFDKGFTEPDPREDLSGMDVARKLLILAREFGLKMELSDIEIESLLPDELKTGHLDSFWEKLPQINRSFEERRAKAESAGRAICYVATLADKTGKVAIKEVEHSHVLARAEATNNIIQITTKRYFDLPLIIQGPGAGREVTAGGVFADVIGLSFHLS
jgi:aspartokinase/homoserine dehydrogenase 1